MTPDLVKQGWDAVKLINGIAKVVGGKGGGRKDFAQAGGKSSKKLDTALCRVETIIATTNSSNSTKSLSPTDFTD